MIEPHKARILAGNAFKSATISRYAKFNLIALLAIPTILCTTDMYQYLSIKTVVAICLSIIISSGYLLHLCGFHWSSAPIIFASYVSLYHLGSISVIAFIPDAANDIAWWSIHWVFTDEAKIAALISTISITSLLLGSSFIHLRTKDTNPMHIHYQHAGFFKVGMLCLIVAIMLILDSIRRGGGQAIILANTRDFRDRAIYGTYYTQAIFLLGLGGIFSIAGASKKYWWSFAIPFSLISIILLITGNRGEVFYPSLVFLILLYRRGIRVPKFIIALGIFIIIIIVPIIAQVRQVGIGRAGELSYSLEPATGLIELGSALRPVTVIVDWTTHGEELLLGSSYWLPFERMLGIFFPSAWERTSPLTDPRFVAYYTYFRTGSPMGFSSIAEAYYNFGYFGSILIFVILGYIIGFLYKQSSSTIGLAILGVVLFPLVNNVRNAFIFVPGQIIYGAILIILTYFYYNRIKKRQPTQENISV